MLCSQVSVNPRALWLQQAGVYCMTLATLRIEVSLWIWIRGNTNVLPNSAKVAHHNESPKGTLYIWIQVAYKQHLKFILHVVDVLLVSRYPVILEQFSLRPGSGGAGKYCGGDGVIRKLLFRNKVVLSVLTERRSTRPYGLHGKLFPAFSSFSSPNYWRVFTSFLFCLLSLLSSCHWSGGEDGAAGLNLLHKADGRLLSLGAKTSVSLQPGVRQQCDEKEGRVALVKAKQWESN